MKQGIDTQISKQMCPCMHTSVHARTHTSLIFFKDRHIVTDWVFWEEDTKTELNVQGFCQQAPL